MNKINRLLVALFLGVLVTSVLTSLQSCKTSTVEVEKIVTIHDTIHHDEGPAFVRFISMIPGAVGKSTNVKLETISNSLFTVALPYPSKLYIPIRPDTSMELVATFNDDGQDFSSRFTIPTLHQNAVITWALFRQFDQETQKPAVVAVGATDTGARLSALKPGYCFLRLINGVSDIPSSSTSVDIFYGDSSKTPLYPGHTAFAEIGEYVQVPAGVYNVHVRATGESQDLYPSPSQLFLEGGFYTAAMQGSRANTNDKLSVYAE